ncbi:MAG: hypothetical protein EA424_29115 [Planctomycetaceae bacterium]|nr:MAG: hypothetical protein EA424_29115 [Planctomycetaceae bacterium]
MGNRYINAGMRANRRSDHRSVWLAALLLACSVCQAGCRAVQPPVEDLSARWQAAIGMPDTRARALAWQHWGQSHLESGDVLFVRGQHRILLGLVDFSRLASDLTESPFSHIALVSREGDRLWVYDTVADGPRRTAFADFVADRRLTLLAARRLRLEHRHYASQAIDFCRDVWQQQVPFDDNFRLENGRWYCSELIEMAFRHAGLPLSEPVPIRQLPGYDRVSPAVGQVLLAARSIDPSEPVFFPGNDSLGIWASAALEPLLEPTDIRQPPQPTIEVAKTVANRSDAN